MDLGFVIISEGTFAIVMIAIMVAALTAALIVSRRRTGALLTPVTFFFIFGVIHAVFGRYAAAILTAKYAFVGAATFEPFINQSFLIISIGLTCCLLAFCLIRPASQNRLGELLVRVSSKEAFAAVCRRSRILVLIAVPLIVIGLQRLGGIPLLSDNPRHDRYLLNFTPEHRLDTFLVNRGREMIVFPAAALMLGWYLRKRKIGDALFVAVAGLSCLLTATRSPLLIGLSIVTVVLVWKNRIKTVAFTVLTALAALVASEMALGTDSGPNSGEWSTIERFGADVAEVRDLGWILLKQDERYWGKTFIAGLVPIPSFASDFTQTYHMRTITLEAIGIPLTAAHGGLRITYSGEWFLNFGWFGVVLGGVLYGWMCAYFSTLFHRLTRSSTEYPVGTLLLACAWVALSFMIYMGGTGTGGTLKTYAGILALLLFRLPQYNRRARYAVEPQYAGAAA